MRHIVSETENGATCTCGREWSVWRVWKRHDWGTRYADQTANLLRATARRHAEAANRKATS